MDFWIIFIAIIVFSLIFQILLNYSKLRKIKKLHKLHLTDFNKFIEESEIALSLFKEAGLEDGKVMVTRESDLVLRTPMIDIPQYHQHNVSVFNNVACNHEDIIPAVNGLFMKTKGVFRHRLREVLNPLNWVLFVINLPSHVLKYIGFGEGNIIMKLVQLTYWIFGMAKMLNDLELIDISSII
ncbi:hypothetical protein [Carboxylicivirga sp. M1479]|uniref:hypothetical protein n=1 Tax=Carboxylicivirga sp. M1479 TaxID=2594476 RepID=UPI00117898BB|nr:hypothetical protein [Carboxylicivirga sp. M1479]TRX72686.1 hypothetical protein FNN09_01745 [Carboxylicivirga sp. M1479]